MPASPERRLKLGAAPTFELPDLSGLVDEVQVGPAQKVRVETTYYDTTDLRLARWGMSLRHRPAEGWTLTLPGEPDGGVGFPREVTVPGSRRRPPDQVLDLVQAFLRGTRLAPVARLSTRCLKTTLQNGSGAELAEVVDGEVSVLHGRRVAARFREVEINLRADGQELLKPLLERLRSAGAGPPDPTPNHVRALGPAALGAPEVETRELPPDAPATDHIRNALAGAVQLVLTHDPLIRLGGDPEAVHQARVGTRRLRSHLRTFKPLLDREWTDSLRAELDWLAGELGEVRDREVLLDRLHELASGLPALDARAAEGLLKTLSEATESARAHLLDSMSSQRYFDLLDRLVQAAADPALNQSQAERTAAPADRALPALALKPWRDLRLAVRRLPEHPADQQLHQIRILAKRMRYAAEAAAPAAGRQALKFAKRAAAVQTELGEHQDSITAQTWLRSVKTTRRRAFVAGELYALEAARADDVRQRWRHTWDRLDHPQRREWMTPAPPA